eukprot:3731222-Alexandrium_andersonii.AAC.1
MSASLVGSEMCIRDSPVPAWGALRSGSKTVAQPSGRNNSNSARKQWPVSYTHLTLPTICSV